MSNFQKNNYAYVTKSYTHRSIIVGFIIVACSIFISDNFLGPVMLGIGLSMLLFSTYELFYNKNIKKNIDLNSNIKIIDLNKYIYINKYNTPLSMIIGLSLAYVGLQIVSGFTGMVMLGIGIDLGSNLRRIYSGAERNPFF